MRERNNASRSFPENELGHRGGKVRKFARDVGHPQILVERYVHLRDTMIPEKLSELELLSRGADEAEPS